MGGISYAQRWFLGSGYSGEEEEEAEAAVSRVKSNSPALEMNNSVFSCPCLAGDEEWRAKHAFL